MRRFTIRAKRNPPLRPAHTYAEIEVLRRMASNIEDLRRLDPVSRGRVLSFLNGMFGVTIDVPLLYDKDNA